MGALGDSWVVYPIMLISSDGLQSSGPMFYSLYLTFHLLCRIAEVIQSSYQELYQVVHCLLPSLSCPLRLRYLDLTFWSKCNLLSLATQQKICFTLDTAELFLFYFIFGLLLGHWLGWFSKTIWRRVALSICMYLLLQALISCFV